MMKVKLTRVFVVLIFLLALVDTASATASYISGTDTLTISGAEDIHSVFAQVGPISGKFEQRSYGYYLAIANIVIDGSLKINDTAIVINVTDGNVSFLSDTTPNPYAGSLILDNAVISVENIGSSNELFLGGSGSTALNSVTMYGSTINETQNTTTSTVHLFVHSQMVAGGSSKIEVDTLKLDHSGQVHLNSLLINSTSLRVLTALNVTGGVYRNVTVEEFVSGATLYDPSIDGWINLSDTNSTIVFGDGRAIYSENTTTTINANNVTVTVKTPGKLYESDIKNCIKLKALSGSAILENITHYDVGQRYTVVLNSSDPSTLIQVNLEGILPFSRVDVVFIKDGEGVVDLGTYYTSVDGVVKLLYDKGFSSVIIDAIVTPEEVIPPPKVTPPTPAVSGGAGYTPVALPTPSLIPTVLIELTLKSLLGFLWSPYGVIVVLIVLLVYLLLKD